VNGTTLILTYSEVLNGASDAVASSYMVNVGGSPVAVNSVDANGTTVTLTLTAPVTNSQVVNISYTPPVINPIEDVAGNNAASFSAQTVVNNTPPAQGDTTAPVLVSAVLNKEGFFIALNFDEELNRSSEASLSSFTVFDGGVGNVPVGGVFVGGGSVVLYLTELVGDNVTVSYDPPNVNAIMDLAGNTSTGFEGFSVQMPETSGDSTSPVLQDIYINGNQVHMVYNEAINPASQPAVYNFKLKTASDDGLLQSSLVEFDANEVVVTFSRSVGSGEEVSFEYKIFSSYPPYLEDMSGNIADYFYLNSITNVTGQPTLNHSDWLLEI